MWAAEPGAETAADPLKEGKQLEKIGKAEEALAVYQAAIKASPTEELYRETGSLLGKLQKYDQAQPVLEEALKKYPDSTSLMNLLGLIEFKRGLTADAGKLWEKVLEINPNNSFAKDWIAKVKKTSAAVSVPKDAEPLGASTASEEGDRVTSLVGDPSQELPVAEQEKLGEKLFKDMSALDKYDLATFDNLHRSVIRKCPKTKWAEESCWRLSNLYLMANDEPNHEGVIEVIEHLIKTYPDSLLVPEAKNRILQSYRAAGQNDKVVSLYEELFKLNPNPDEKDYVVWALEYAQALASLNRKDQARGLYEKIIQMDNNRDQIEARVAKEKLAGL